jgi:hypothetical protein
MDQLEFDFGQGYVPPTLSRAVAIWEQDKPIPMTLVADLMGLGYDVARLEREYRKA